MNIEKRTRTFRYSALALGVLVLISYVVFLFIQKPVDVEIQDSISAGELESGLEIDFTITEVDPKLLQTHFQMRLEANGDIAGAFGRRDMAGVPLQIMIYGCDCDVDIAAGEELPVVSGTLPLEVTRSINAWPLDEYRTDITLQVLSGDTLVPVSLTPTALATSGYSLVYEPLEGTDNILASPGGAAFAQVVVTRSDDTKLIALVLSIGVLLQVTVLVILAIAGVRGKRSLRLRDEFWITTFLIALPALRAAMPGSPPLGIAFDVFFFYWAVLAVTCVFVIILLRILLVPEASESPSGAEASQDADD